VNPNPSNEPWCFFPNDPTPPTCYNDGVRNDCGAGTQGLCESRGCCWDPVQGAQGIPWCFAPNEPPFAGYTATTARTNTGLALSLTPLTNGTTPYGAPIQQVSASVVYETQNRLHVKFVNAEDSRYEVPASLLPRPAEPTSKPAAMDYAFTMTNSPFGFAVSRRSDGRTLFNTTSSGSFGNFVFADQYWELSTSLNEGDSLFGLGESTQSGGFKLVPGSTYTLWARDCPSAVTNQNLYGSHPFYLNVAADGSAHGVFLANSNGMDVTYGSGATSLTYRVIGGIPDFYFFLGPSPASVIAQYMEVIGKPHMPPLWSLGFHQCRYGYPNIQTVETVVADYKKANIPLQVMWNDIDYMDQYKDFTFDPNNYPLTQVQAFVNQLHQNGQQYVVIVDPGIASTDPNYMPLQRGNADNVWIRDGNNNPFQGKVWPGLVYFPDFQLNPKAQSYWQTEIQDFLAQVPVDGLWIDMNEISNFCDGECGGEPPKSGDGGAHVRVRGGRRASRGRGSAPPTKGQQPSLNSASLGQFNPTNPPYPINDCGSGCPLHSKTISMESMHYPYTLGDSDITEYNLHNLFGLAESIATKESLQNLSGGKRAFVITRSTFPGSGHHVGHWTGDNASDWPDLTYSINGILNFNLFGVPLVGADICGFLGSTTEEMCARWIQLGSFYSFCRNHNTLGAPSQELYLWPSVAAISRTVLTNRYVLSPYWYTLLFQAHTTGSTVTRPLLFEFPADPQTFDINQQFMVGPALLITPVLAQGATTVTGYFPQALWYDWWTGAPLQGSVPGSLTLSAPLNVINVHMRGGYVIPTQGYSSVTGSIVRSDPYSLIVALDQHGAASGSLFADDGETTAVGVNSLQVSYTVVTSGAASKATTTTLTNSVATNTYPPAAALGLASVTVYGQRTQPTSATFNGAPITPSYNQNTMVLTFSLPQTTLSTSINLSWQ
jgi:alpha-glucosidase (family GH31 glycosyl hydrolase)